MEQPPDSNMEASVVRTATLLEGMSAVSPAMPDGGLDSRGLSGGGDVCRPGWLPLVVQTR